VATTFLTAEWRKLLMANYVVSPELLLPYLPTGTEMDLYQGRCYVSLVGFLFRDTRLRGVRVPFHVEFEEVNLRFYVLRDARRGVVFIREIVPRLALQIVANTFYGEKYATARMWHEWSEENAELTIRYGWMARGRRQEIKATAGIDAAPIATGSEEEFITEHYWGYTARHGGCTSEYEVVHPRWNVYGVKSYEIDVDFGLVYGSQFAGLNDQRPESVLLAEGSEVVVRSGARISGKEDV
jgi:uncharacterized protein